MDKEEKAGYLFNTKAFYLAILIGIETNALFTEYHVFDAKVTVISLIDHGARILIVESAEIPVAFIPEWGQEWSNILTWEGIFLSPNVIY